LPSQNGWCPAKICFFPTQRHGWEPITQLPSSSTHREFIHFKFWSITYDRSLEFYKSYGKKHWFRPLW
jgi:hypothetical protein